MSSSESKIRLVAVGHSYLIDMNRHVLRCLAAHGHFEVTIVAPRQFHGDLRFLTCDVEPPHTGVRLEVIDAHLTQYIHLFWYETSELRRMLSTQRFDVAHIWQEPYTLAGSQLASLFCEFRIPYVFRTAQNLRKWYPFPFSYFEKHTIRRAIAWVAGATLVRQAMLARGYPSNNGSVITLGVDTGRFQPLSEERKAERKLALGLRGVVIGFIGRFEEAKGLRVFMSCLQTLPQGSDVSVLFLGSGRLKGVLEDWVARAGYQGRCLIRLAIHNEMPSVVPVMDILLAPSLTSKSWREQFERMILEAMACGVSVIGSDSGEIPAVIGEAGLCVPEADMKGWVTALTRVVGDPVERQRFKCLGIERASLFSSEAIAEQYAVLYRGIAAGLTEPVFSPSLRHSKQTRRVLSVGHSYAVSLNRVLAHEIEKQSRGRWEVTTVSPTTVYGDLRRIDFSEVEDDRGRAISQRLWMSRWVHLMAYGRGVSAVLAKNWDIVHLWQEPYIAAAAQVSFLTPKRTPMVFYTYQNINKKYPPPFSWFEQYTLQRSSAWIAGGVTTREVMLKRGYGIREHFTISLGVDVCRFKPSREWKRAILDQLGWDDGVPVVGYLGRFHPSKGLRVLMAALETITTPWRCLLVGGGAMESELRLWACRRPDRVRVMTGISHELVPKYLNAMTMLVAPSLTTSQWREQFGRMIIEAFACGIPVIASDSGEIPFVVASAGIVVEEGVPDALAKAIQSLLENPDLRADMAKAGLDRAAEKFSWSLIARQHVSAFEQVLDTQRIYPKSWGE